MARTKNTVIRREQNGVSQKSLHGSKSKPKVESQVTERRKRRYRPGTRALMQIRKFQKSTNLLIPRSSFSRLVREIANQYGEFKFTKTSIIALQTSAEAYLIDTFEKSYRGTMSRKGKTLEPKDMHLLRQMRNDPLDQNPIDCQMPLKEPVVLISGKKTKLKNPVPAFVTHEMESAVPITPSI